MSNMNTVVVSGPTLRKGRPFFVRKPKAGLVLTLGMLLVSSAACAQKAVLDTETKALANQVMLNIYKQILEDKDKYGELRAFGEKNLFENKEGIYAISYKLPDDEKLPFEFGVTVAPTGSTVFSEHGAYAFNLEFPFLGLKFAGYVKKHIKRGYNVLDVINEKGIPLSDYQQNFMPLRLELRADKTEFKAKEPVRFVVELKNASKRHMWVKNLTEETLYCLFNNLYWGAKSHEKGSASVILKAGDSLKRVFEGEGPALAEDVEIYCSYSMSLRGVKPSGVLKVKIVE